MKLREYLRKEFSMYIRSRLVKDECEWCGETKDLHFHHIDRFHNLLNETLEELNLNELDTKEYHEYELNLISSVMLAKQIKGEYKTLCKRCHFKLHAIEKNTDEYKNNYKNPFGNYFNINLEYLNKLKGNYLFRFLKVCSYINYDGYIVCPDKKEKCKFANKKDIFSLLLISEREYMYTINYFFKNNLMSIDDKNYIKINSNVAFRGKINSRKKINTIKIFSTSMIRLYNNIPTTSQTKVSYIFKLSNFINIKYNIINENVIERNLDNIESLSINCIGRIGNINEHSVNRILKVLRETKIDECNNLLYKIEINSKIHHIVNPCLMYGGLFNNDILDCYNLINSDNIDGNDK